MNAQERLDKYMAMRKQAEEAFRQDPSVLAITVKLIGDLERDIRACRKELGLPEWGYR